MTKQRFEIGVIEHLQCYVYRLIDPRNGETFYVGKGTGNRVFDHVYEEKRSPKGSVLPEKLNQIQEIKEEGLDVIHIIHRHGMDEKTALEVEGALIDVYPALKNVAGGIHNSAKGMMDVNQINEKYAMKTAEIRHKVIIFCINKEYKKQPDNVYDAVRFVWGVDLKRAKRAEVLLAVADGIIRGAFVNAEWMPGTLENFPNFNHVEKDQGKFGFIASDAPTEIQELYLGRKLPESMARKIGDRTSFKYNYK